MELSVPCWFVDFLTFQVRRLRPTWRIKCVRGGSPTTDWHQESHLGGPWQSWNQERGCGMVNLVQWHPKLTSWELLQLNPPQTNQLGAEKNTNSGWFIIPIQQEGPPKSQHPGKPKALLPTCCQSWFRNLTWPLMKPLHVWAATSGFDQNHSSYLWIAFVVP